MERRRASFEVHRTDTGADLTEAECFDRWPTDEQIAALLPTSAGAFACRGCGAVFRDDEGDLYVELDSRIPSAE